MAKILIVEDDLPLQAIVSAFLRDEGHDVATASAEAEGCELLTTFEPDVVVTDLMLETGSGLNVLKAARACDSPIDVILVTAHATSHTAAQAMQEGAYEYLQKPYELDEIAAIIARIEKRRVLVRQSVRGPGGVSVVQNMIAESPAMQDVLSLVRDVIASGTSVLLRGESGTGKEVLARYIHENGPRAQQPFVAVNCGAITESLLGSELFGHEKGAFTGAVSQKQGAFECAHQGTLLLDEIGDVSLQTQIHLLRVLESRELTRVGGTQSLSVDVRLIAATHQDLEALIKEKRFRDDLYFRLNVYPILIPPLRERREDIAPLVELFLSQSSCTRDRITDEALERLTQHEWPGNVRELRNISENLLIRSRGGIISADLVNTVLPMVANAAPAVGVAPVAAPTTETLEAVEARQIRAALEMAGGNKSEAARRLGITRRRMYSRMKILGIAD